MEEVRQVSAISGYGLEGDVNANSLSPRQILLTRYEDLQIFRLSPGDLRENIVLQGLSEKEFVPGSEVTLGDVKIRLTFNCEPCKRVAQFVKPSEIIGKRGILGVVLSSGLLKQNMEAHVKLNAFESLSEIPFERFLNFIEQVPEGKVVTYKDVIIAIGVSHGYIRAIPNYIIKAARLGYPVHRIVNSEGRLIPEYTQSVESFNSRGDRSQNSFRIIFSRNIGQNF